MNLNFIHNQIEYLEHVANMLEWAISDNDYGAAQDILLHVQSTVNQISIACDDVGYQLDALAENN